ncbi:MAG: trigger factor, partial [bacterium]|nr:trigger factor [bacterium]
KFDEINGQVALPGFRPGRAPRQLLERKFGSKLADEIKGDLVKAALESLVEDEKVEALAPPEIDVEAIELERGKPMTFEFELVTRPEFETPKYKGLEVKVPPVLVKDEEVDNAVDNLRRRSATLEDAPDATVQAEDILIVDWEAREGDSVEAKDTNHYYPYGRGVIAGFVAEDLDAQFEGKQAGAEAKAKVQVAIDDPREELRGRELDLTVTLKDVKRYVLPEIDAAFLEKNDFDDADEMRADMKKSLSRQHRRHIERGAEEKLVEQLLGDIKMDLPEQFVEQELEGWASRKRTELQMAETAEDEITKQVDTASGDAREAIEDDLKRHFVLDRIADEESLDVTEQELFQAIQEIAQVYNQPLETVMGSFRDGNRLAELKAQIRHRKVREVIRSGASLVEDESLLKEEDEKAEKKPAKKKSSK